MSLKHASRNHLLCYSEWDDSLGSSRVVKHWFMKHFRDSAFPTFLSTHLWTQYNYGLSLCVLRSLREHFCIFHSSLFFAVWNLPRIRVTITAYHITNTSFSYCHSSHICRTFKTETNKYKYVHWNLIENEKELRAARNLRLSQRR
jgi:hypothetical protein